MTDPNWRKRPKFWTPDRLFELSGYLEQGWSDERIGREFGKSKSAIQLARKRHGIRCTRCDVMSARRVAALLGIPDSKTIMIWIERGYLRARRGQQWGPNRQWYITWDDLTAFLESPDHWHRWRHYQVADDRLRWWVKTLPVERYLSLSEVADRYCVQTATVHSWIKNGLLPRVRHGNHVVPESALVGFTPPGQRSKLGRWRTWSPEQAGLLIRLRAQGWTWRQISDALGRAPRACQSKYLRLVDLARLEAA